MEDTGCGIREEDQEKIFEDFKQVDSKKNRTVEGTGLGLSITKHLVQLMGGSLGLKSVYGKGTTFSVILPQRIVDRRTLEEMPEVPVEEEADEEMFVARDYKVLIVDDNLINRKVAKGFLKNYEFEMYEADSGAESIELVKKMKFDMIFMDHMMPEMDGIEAVQIIRGECGENGESPIIIALTANAMEGVREKFLANGFQDFIAKPLERRELAEVLSKWIPEERREYVERDAVERENMDFDSIHIHGIDMEVVKQRYSGIVSDFTELLQLYLMDGKKKIELLRRLFDEGDYTNYQIETHGLKSASANIGAVRLSDLARAHEEAADRGDTEFIAENISDFLSAYEKQMADIREFMDKTQGNTDDRDESLPDIDRDALIKGVEEALSLLQGFHSHECAAKLEELQGFRLDEETAAGITKVQEQLKMYEDDIAEQQLQQLLQKLQ